MTEGFPSGEKFGLTSQLRRAAVSVPSNIAEGQARRSEREFRRFLYVALGSLAEVDTQLIIAEELGYVTNQDTATIMADLVELRKMLSGLLASLSPS